MEKQKRLWAKEPNTTAWLEVESSTMCNGKWVSHQISACFYRRPLRRPRRNPAQPRIQRVWPAVLDKSRRSGPGVLLLWLPSSAFLETERRHRQPPSLLISIALLLAGNACQCPASSQPLAVSTWSWASRAGWGGWYQTPRPVLCPPFTNKWPSWRGCHMDQRRQRLLVG